MTAGSRWSYAKSRWMPGVQKEFDKRGGVQKLKFNDRKLTLKNRLIINTSNSLKINITGARIYGFSFKAISPPPPQVKCIFPSFIVTMHCWEHSSGMLFSSVVVCLHAFKMETFNDSHEPGEKKKVTRNKITWIRFFQFRSDTNYWMLRIPFLATF